MLLPPCFQAHRLATPRPDKNSHFLCILAWETPRKKAISAWSGRSFKCRVPSHRGCSCVYCQPVCVVKLWLAVSYRARSGPSMFVHRHRLVTGTPTVHQEMWIDAAKWYAFRAILDTSSSGRRMSIVHRVMFSCPLINASSSLCPPSFKFSLRFFYVNIFHLLTSFHDVLFFHLPISLLSPFLYEAWKPIYPYPIPPFIVIKYYLFLFLYLSFSIPSPRVSFPFSNSSTSCFVIL